MIEGIEIGIIEISMIGIDMIEIEKEIEVMIEKTKDGILMIDRDQDHLYNIFKKISNQILKNNTKILL